MLYLQASAIVISQSAVEVLEEYNGEKGLYIKTFALNDKRNKNGWRVTWQSIKQNIHTFIERPGIEYTKCEGSVCDLDHTDGATFAQALKNQEPFRVTTIVDYVLDEGNHTAYFIHRVEDPEFYERVKNGEIKYVSPSIWPLVGGFEIIQGEKMPSGLPKIDVFAWVGLHDAFVNKPAFGDDAKVTTTCEGEGCHMRLLSAKQLLAVNSSENELTPIETIPILVKHKDRLVFVSVSKEQAEKIGDLEKVQESEVLSILKQRNDSFTACSCSSAHRKNMQELKDPEKLTAALKAAEQDNEDKDKKIKELESKLKAMEDKAKKAADTSSDSDSSDNDDDDKKEDDSQKSAKKGGTKNASVIETSSFKAQISALEARVASPLVEKMLTARRIKGASEEAINSFAESLKAKSLAEIEGIYANEEIFIKDLSARAEADGSTGKIHFEFNGGSSSGALSAKSLEDVFEEVPRS